mgnify:CR=1 FL=1
MDQETHRRNVLRGIAAIVATAVFGNNVAEANSAEKKENVISPVRLEAKRWSELSEILKKYEAIIDREQEGVSRIFGYASIIKKHDNEKPAASRHIKNERAQLPGMEVAMNVLAAGEWEFRGTRGTYRQENGKTIQEGEDGVGKHFASVGIYAGLEAAANNQGFADGMNITVSKEDRHASLIAYMERELGKPPGGLTLAEIFHEEGRAKFEALKNTPQDEFGMYKFQVVNTQTEGRSVPAVTVATNEDSKFARIGLTPMQAAHMILDGQGYRRTMGVSKTGGSALDYFKQNAIGVARELKLNQPRLEAIDAAVEKLAKLYTEINEIIEKKLPLPEEAQAIEALKERYPDFMGNGDNSKAVATPYFMRGENVNKRDVVSPEDRALPENEMAHTAEEKLRRVRGLQGEGKTSRTP